MSTGINIINTRWINRRLHSGLRGRAKAPLLGRMKQADAAKTAIAAIEGEVSAQADPVRTVLDNGITLISCEDHSAELASLQVWVKTGSIHEGGLLGAGLSHYLEHMLFKGTGRRGPLDISREVHAIGGSINAYTTYDRTVYHIDLPSEHLEQAFDILSDMCLHARIPDDQAVSERDVILREIDMGLDDPDWRLFQKFVSTAYREHPYRFPVIGHRQLVEELSAADLKAYYHGRYVPANLVVVAVGAFDTDHLQSLCHRYFGCERTRRLTPASFAAEPPQLAARRLRESGDVKVTRGLLGFKIPGLSHSDAPALDVLAQVLARGRSSLLWQRLRDSDGWVHQIDGGCWNPGSEGLLWISYNCDPRKGAGVEAVIFEEMEKLCRGDVPEKLIHKVVRQAVVSEVNARKSMSGQAARLGAAEVVAGELDFPRIHLKWLKAVSGDRVSAAAAHYLAETRMTSVQLVPTVSAGKKRPLRRNGSCLPDFQEHRLANGATLLLQPVGALPKLHIRTAFLGGALFEPPQRRGATSLLATMLTRDTSRRSAREVAEEMEQVGGSFSDFCGNNAFGLSLEIMPEDCELALDILQQALIEPAFKEAMLEREREAQIASIHEDEDEILDYAFRRMRGRYFGTHPLAVDASGREEDLHAITREDLIALRDQLIVPANTVLAVSGQFDPDALVPALEALLKQVPGVASGQSLKSGSGLGATLERMSGAYPQTPCERGDFVETLDREQAVVLAAFPDIGVGDPKFRAGDLACELFSGMSSNLFKRVREEQGLAYYVGASRLSGLERGMFTFYAGTHPAKAAKVLAEIHAEVKRVLEGEVKADELSACKAHMKARHRMGLQAPGSRAMQAALNRLYGLEVNRWRTMDAEVDALDVEQVRHFMSGWDAGALNLIVGPAPD